MHSSAEEYGHFFELSLDVFDGPIDLLLHLVKRRELPIEKVSLAEVTAQYLQCIECVREYDLEVAGEYLVIAATLLSIKAAVLLNEPPQLIEDEDGNLIDPHEELLRRLREAEVYRDAANKLIDRELLGVDVFASPSSLNDIEAPPVTYKDHDPLLLGKALRKMLAQGGFDAPTMTFSVDAVSIVERMSLILKRLQAEGGTKSFVELIPNARDKASVISTFVALLELCKRQVIRVHQQEGGEEILISIAVDSVNTEGLTSEFDIERGAEKEAVSGA